MGGGGQRYCTSPHLFRKRNCGLDGWRGHFYGAFNASMGVFDKTEEGLQCHFFGEKIDGGGKIVQVCMAIKFGIYSLSIFNYIASLLLLSPSLPPYSFLSPMASCSSWMERACTMGKMWGKSLTVLCVCTQQEQEQNQTKISPRLQHATGRRKFLFVNPIASNTSNS